MSTLNVTNIKAADGTSGLTIANSTGIITNSTKPAFSSYRSSALNISNTMQVIVYNTAVHNQGGHYNTSTGVFTAPVTGVYYFSAALAITVANDNRYFNIYLQTNATAYQGIIMTGRTHTKTTTGATYGQTNLQGIVPLNANDTVRIYNEIENSSALYVSDRACYFTGYLIG
jgi:hypothetical protein